MAKTRVDYPGVYEERTPVYAYLATREEVLPPAKLLTILSVSALSSTSVRITFNNPVNDTPVLRWTGAYVFSPALTVTSVVPEAVTNPTYVTLTTSEMKQGQAYVPTVYTIALAVP